MVEHGNLANLLVKVAEKFPDYPVLNELLQLLVAGELKPAVLLTAVEQAKIAENDFVQDRCKLVLDAYADYCKLHVPEAEWAAEIQTIVAAETNKSKEALRESLEKLHEVPAVMAEKDFTNTTNKETFAAVYINNQFQKRHAYAAVMRFVEANVGVDAMSLCEALLESEVCTSMPMLNIYSALIKIAQIDWDADNSGEKIVAIYQQLTGEEIQTMVHACGPYLPEQVKLLQAMAAGVLAERSRDREQKRLAIEDYLFSYMSGTPGSDRDIAIALFFTAYKPKGFDTEAFFRKCHNLSESQQVCEAENFLNFLTHSYSKIKPLFEYYDHHPALEAGQKGFKSARKMLCLANLTPVQRAALPLLGENKLERDFYLSLSVFMEKATYSPAILMSICASFTDIVQGFEEGDTSIAQIEALLVDDLGHQSEEGLDTIWASRKEYLEGCVRQKKQPTWQEFVRISEGMDALSQADASRRRSNWGKAGITAALAVSTGATVVATGGLSLFVYALGILATTGTLLVGADAVGQKEFGLKYLTRDQRVQAAKKTNPDEGFVVVST